MFFVKSSNTVKREGIENEIMAFTTGFLRRARSKNIVPGYWDILKSLEIMKNGIHRNEEAASRNIIPLQKIPFTGFTSIATLLITFRPMNLQTLLNVRKMILH